MSVPVRVSDLPELELQAVMSCHVGTENWDPPKEQPMLLTNEPSLQTIKTSFLRIDFKLDRRGGIRMVESWDLPWRIGILSRSPPLCCKRQE